LKSANKAAVWLRRKDRKIVNASITACSRRRNEILSAGNVWPKAALLDADACLRQRDVKTSSITQVEAQLFLIDC
jgi:hypothetical protein